MSETAVATPSTGEGAASSDSQSSALGFESQGALLEAMGLPNRASEGAVKQESKPEPPSEGEGKEFAFEFAGQVYKGKTEAEARSKAEHAMKVHRGQAQASSREVARLKTQLAQLERRAPGSAPHTPQTQTQTKGSAPAAPATSKEGEGKAEDGNLLGLTDEDWTFVRQLRTKGEHDMADAFLLGKQEEALKRIQGATKAETARLKQELKDEFDALRKPEQQRQAQQAEFNKAVEAFHNRADFTDPDTGEAVYPELRDDDTIDEITDTWSRMVDPVADYPALPAEFATTPAGVHTAYTVWFHETYAPLVRAALAAGFDNAGQRSTSPAPPAAAAGNRGGRLSAPVMLPTPTPRREPAAPRGPGSSAKDMLTSKDGDNLI